ncbi:MAG: HAD-IA family hydrolase [Xanthomonadales bacterium]|nr:HAD-IA family hydrolase [Xanthomonadales bacterium]
MIRALTFDLDDTLWPISPVMRTAETVLRAWFVRNAPRVAKRFDRDAMWALRGELVDEAPERAHDLSALRKAVIERALTRCGYPASMADEAYDLFYAARHEVSFFEDVLPALRRLVDHYPMATISNGSARVERLGLRDYFRFSVFPHEVSRPKPHVEMFELAAERFGLEPAEILHVGDNLDHDIVGAREAGFQVVWVNRNAHPAVEGVESVACLNELADSLLADTGAALER